MTWTPLELGPSSTKWAGQWGYLRGASSGSPFSASMTGKGSILYCRNYGEYTYVIIVTATSTLLCLAAYIRNWAKKLNSPIHIFLPIILIQVIRPLPTMPVTVAKIICVYNNPAIADLVSVLSFSRLYFCVFKDK